MTVERTYTEQKMVDDLHLLMHAKLSRAREKGRGGWADPADCTVAHLWNCLREHTLKANLDMIDVANLAGMVWWRIQNVPGDRELLAEHVANLEQGHEQELARLREGIKHVQWSMLQDELFSGSETPRGRQVAWWSRELTDILTPPAVETITCTWCGGSGGDCDDSSKPCDECDGSGTKTRRVWHGRSEQAETMARVHGLLDQWGARFDELYPNAGAEGHDLRLAVANAVGLCVTELRTALAPTQTAQVAEVGEA